MVAAVEAIRKEGDKQRGTSEESSRLE